MKPLVVLLATFLCLGSFGFTGYAEINNPYPPPPLSVAPGTPGTASQYGNGPSGEAILADLLLVRPLSIGAYAVGNAAAIVALPFTLKTHTTKETYRKLGIEPLDFAVCRPLGEF